MNARPKLVLFDFDGVLAHYSRESRIAHLATATGCEPRLVGEVLFESGLEADYDGGVIDTAQYLSQLGYGLGCAVDEAIWIASRIAGNRAEPDVEALVREVARHARVGVLTNNGALMTEAIRGILPGMFPVLDGSILCSGALGVCKPHPEVYRLALAHFRVEPHQTLFVDDAPCNVEGARNAGLRAAHVHDAGALAAVLREHGLA